MAAVSKARASIPLLKTNITRAEQEKRRMVSLLREDSENLKLREAELTKAEKSLATSLCNLRHAETAILPCLARTDADFKKRYAAGYVPVYHKDRDECTRCEATPSKYHRNYSDRSGASDQMGARGRSQ